MIVEKKLAIGFWSCIIVVGVLAYIHLFGGI